MLSRFSVILFPVAALAACAGATTMRVADDEGNAEEPVALAPTPEAGPDQTNGQAPTAPPAEAAQPPPPPQQDQGYAPYGSGGALESRRIGQWTRTGISEARRLVIRDANSWADFWSELGMGDRPEVDFTRDLIVAVAAGQRSSGGYEIAIDRVWQASGELTVEVVETAPGPNCITTAALTQPVDVVAVPAVSVRSWSFIEHRKLRGCR